MDAITPRKAILLQKTQSFVEQARASADNETVENKALKAEKKHEKPPNTKRKALKKHKSDTFEVTTKPKLVPQPVIITTKVDPASNRGTLVLATMGFIASLGAVFGVGVLLAKSNQAEEAMATRFTNLEQAITTEWQDILTTLGGYLQENANGTNKTLASVVSATNNLSTNFKLMIPYFDENSEKWANIDQKIEALANFVNRVMTNTKREQHIARSIAEEKIQIGKVRGGEDGFIEAYMVDCEVKMEKITESLDTIKRDVMIKHLEKTVRLNLDDQTRLFVDTIGESLPEALVANVPEMPTLPYNPFDPLLTFMKELKEPQKENPLVLQLVLKEMQQALENSLKPVLDENKTNEIKTFIDKLTIYERGLNYYINEEKYYPPQAIQDNQNLGTAFEWYDSVAECRRNNFTIQPETLVLMVHLKDLLEYCKKNFI